MSRRGVYIVYRGQRLNYDPPWWTASRWLASKSAKGVTLLFCLCWVAFLWLLAITCNFIISVLVGHALMFSVLADFAKKGRTQWIAQRHLKQQRSLSNGR